MNRQQAGHILDAYVQTVKFVDDEEPSVALREVILDAMTEYKTLTTTVPSTTIPSITYPQTTPNWGKNIVTCGVSD